MHAEALGGGVREFDEAVHNGACPYLNQLGETALGEMRAVYEQLDTGNYEALGALAERLAAAASQTAEVTAPIEVPVDTSPPKVSAPTLAASTDHLEMAYITEVQQADLARQQSRHVIDNLESMIFEETPLATVEAAERNDKAFLRPATKPKPAVAIHHPTKGASEQPIQSGALVQTLQAEVPIIEAPDEVIAVPAAELDFRTDTVSEMLEAPADISSPTAPPTEAIYFRQAEAAPVEPLELTEPPTDTAGELGQDLDLAELGNDGADQVSDPLPEVFYLDEAVPESQQVNAYSMSEQLAPPFEAETVQTYLEIMSVINYDVVKPDAPESPPDPNYTSSSETVYEIPTKVFTLPTQDFENFVANMPDPEEISTIEAIKEQIDKKPLEEILVLLAKNLPEIGDEPTQEVISAILRDIESELPNCFDLREGEKPRPHITPELTEKAITLLRHLGYENPGEILVVFVKQHSLDFLLQALQYLCLTDENRRMELLLVSARLSDDNPPRLHLIKAVYNLISRTSFEVSFQPAK
jgi:hypothetical protein